MAVKDRTGRKAIVVKSYLMPQRPCKVMGYTAKISVDFTVR